ncbi:highly reducing polyketide synthase cla2-like isoform X1 [Pomacea canaliculata]|uniref:highly reducing polyketide synthase cla2-like isoform X1 n=1 Tax=Pomacea canaliculata TaxID=400727 RepID=UPI000D72DF36|nr:highly reducing polyketide synthase cla2-like isoform X1 [Pomacea canaliculata]
MDPQQSLLLECTYRALENGGITHISGTNTGVFVGAMTSDHAVFYPAGSPEVDSYTATGVSSSMLAARVSYVYNLLGPSMVIDTACSSSLVAIHQGIQAIKNGDCGMAICGGVNYIGAPTMFVQLSKTKMLSPTGQSRAFSADADGYVRGEGCGIVVLKRLKDALDNNDHIWATVVSGVNQDGHTVTPVTAPSGTQQEKLMTDIYTKYGVDVSRLDYIEAHGTGTQAGDPVEVNAIGKFLKAMGQPRTRYIGSVKTNIGHLEAGAGVIGVIKVLLMMKHNTIVPSLHCKKVNPLIDLENLGLIVPQSLVEWESKDKMACCNSFGFGGTNSHVVLQTFHKEKNLVIETRSSNVVCFSGKTKQSLIGSMKMIREMDFLGMVDGPQDEKSEENLLTNIAYVSSVKRTHYVFRKAFVVDKIPDLRHSISFCLEQKLQHDFSRRRHVVFVFCGMGTTRPGMCLQMMKEFPVFKETMLRVDAILKEIIKTDPWSLVDRLSKEDPSTDPVLSPIAVFACQVALVTLWKSLGVTPACVLGQSVGEVAAAYTAGCLSLETAVKVIYYRSKVLAQVAGGQMKVIKNCSVEKIREILQVFDKATIALEYSPVSCAVSADSDTMAKIHQSLAPHLYSEDKRVQLIPLNVPVAYHSQFVESCQPELASVLDNIEAKSPKIPYISAVTGEKMTSAPGQGYWVNHLRKPVLFGKAVQTARKESPTNTVFVEIGPISVLKAHLKDIFPTEDIPLIQSMYSSSETKVFLQSVASLYELGVEVTWAALYNGSHDIVDIPRYVFDKKISLNRSTARALIPSGTQQVSHHPYLSRMPNTNDFKITLSTVTTSFVYDHRVKNHVLVPGAVYVEAGLEVALHLRYDPHNQAVVSVDFMSHVSANSGEFMELDLKSDTDLNTGNKQHLGVSVRKGERVIAIVHIEWQPLLPTTQRTINLQHIRDKCTVCVQKNKIYFSLKRLGFEYGKTFSLLEKAYRGEGECLAQIKVISEVSKDFVSTTIHPCVLDVMFQSVVVINDNEENSHLQLLADTVKRLKVFGAMETVMYVHSRFIRDDGKRSSYKLTLLSTKGLVLATVEEFILIRINVEDHCGLPMLMAMHWSRVCKMWDVDTRISEHAFILHTKQSPGITEGKNVTCLRLSDHARDWDEIYDEVKTVMQDAACAPAIVVVCDTEFSENVNCDDLDLLVLNTCGAVHSVLRLARDLNFKMPVYICTNGAWPTVGSCEQIQVNPAGTCVWGMMRTAQAENLYPHLVTVDLHIPAKHLTSQFLSLMALNLSSSHELRDNSEVLITTKAVYVNRINRVDRHTTVPLLRDLPFDLDEHFLVVSNEAEVLSNAFAVKISAPMDMNTCNVTITADSFALPSPYLTKSPIVYNKNIAGPNKYLVFALETIGQLNQGDNTVIVSCCPVKAGRRVSVPIETIVPASLIPDYRAGDLTKLVLLFALSERVSTDDITILTSDNHVGLARVMKMKLETDNRTRVVNVEEARNLKSATIQSETVVSFILLDSDVISTLVGQWSNAKRLVTCDALITPEAIAYLAYMFPEVDIQSVDTQLLFKPYKLKHFVVEVKSWLKEQYKEKLSRISRYMHSFEKAYVANSEICENMLSRMLSFTELNLRNTTVKVDSQNMFHGNSVYIVVGGLQGLGWIVVKFLARNGAKNIAIIQRRTPSADHCSNIAGVCSQFHVIIHVFQADVTITKSVEEVLYRVGERFANAALKGIFFGAAAVDDGAFPSMNRDRFDKALAPKVKGAWNFHLLTKHLPLDFFVMHSSAESVLGYQGQANYSAGNAFLDGLAYYRRHLGLPAQSFSWGPLATGLLDNKEDAQRKLESKGFYLMSEAEIDKSLSPLLMLNWPHCAPIKLDEKQYFARLKASGIQHIIKRFQFSVSLDVTTPNFDNIDVAAAKTKDPAARLELYRSYVRQLASRILTVDQSQVTLDTNLTDLGLDSVSSTMLIDQIYRDTNIRLSAVILISGEATVGNIAQTLTDNSDSSSET